MAASVNFAPVYPLKLFGTTVPCYIALAALVVNIVVAVVLSLYSERGGVGSAQGRHGGRRLRVTPPDRRKDHPFLIGA